MTAARARRLARSIAAVTVVLVAVMVWLSAGREETFDTVLYGLLALSFSGMGAVIVSTAPENRIGWLFLLIGFLNGVWECGEGWGHYAREHDLAGGATGEWIILWSWIIDLGLFALVFLLFPNGRLPGDRWRIWLWIIAGAVLLALPGQALNAGLGSEFTSGENPLGVQSLPTDVMLNVGMVVLTAALAAGIGSLVVRFRRGAAIERQQIKWIALSASLLVVSILPAFFFWYESILPQIAVSLSLISLPIAAAIAITRHRLYDIDVVINRTLVYGSLTGLLGGAYVGSVLLLQLVLSPSSDVAIAGSTLAVAALFGPARDRIQALVDRRFFRRRYDAQRTLEVFTVRLRDQVSLEAVDADLRAAVSETIQPVHLSVWLRGRGA